MLKTNFLTTHEETLNIIAINKVMNDNDNNLQLMRVQLQE